MIWLYATSRLLALSYKHPHMPLITQFDLPTLSLAFSSPGQASMSNINQLMPTPEQQEQANNAFLKLVVNSNVAHINAGVLSHFK
jgi:cell division FtsZ-interacting protein ZapD